MPLLDQHCGYLTWSHDEMVIELGKKGCCSLVFAVSYLTDLYNGIKANSLIPFNPVARAAFPWQVSSAASERLFNNLGRLECSKRQSILCHVLEMTEVARQFVIKNFHNGRRPVQKLCFTQVPHAFGKLLNTFPGLCHLLSKLHVCIND